MPLYYRKKAASSIGTNAALHNYSVHNSKEWTYRPTDQLNKELIKNTHICITT